MRRIEALRTTAPRTVLVGNAAQTLHPIGAQGFNLGLRDALTLAELLIDAARRGADPGASELLARHVQMRRADREGTAATSDGLDGYIARRYKQRSELGAILDPIADKGLLLSGIITLSISNWSEVDPDYGRFPAWFPVIVITRDAVIVVGAAILHMLIGNKMKVRPSWTGKVATVCQMCAIGWVMLQVKLIPLIVVVGIAGFFTVVSGVIYVLDGVRQLQAEGHAHPNKT